MVSLFSSKNSREWWRKHFDDLVAKDQLTTLVEAKAELEFDPRAKEI
ncbi:MAG: hypothetical protein HOK49_02210 [Opitutae bacterium]|jgi:hypothetical protein|nr:hypothetical protein [Opitutae bacterium]MBT5691966.1 hypothetical protein [Opitutae bacterium]MBT6461330.1 hypothetical protein [Opitutae bacterium]